MSRASRKQATERLAHMAWMYARAQHDGLRPKDSDMDQALEAYEHEILRQRRAISFRSPIVWPFPRKTVKDLWQSTSRQGEWIGRQWLRLGNGSSLWARLVFWIYLD